MASSATTSVVAQTTDYKLGSPVFNYYLLIPKLNNFFFTFFPPKLTNHFLWDSRIIGGFSGKGKFSYIFSYFSHSIIKLRSHYVVNTFVYPEGKHRKMSSVYFCSTGYASVLRPYSGLTLSLSNGSVLTLHIRFTPFASQDSSKSTEAKRGAVFLE